MKLCVCTGGRAEYGILKSLMGLIAGDSELQLQICATGMHLSPSFGLTINDLKSDGFSPDKEIEILLASDTGVGTSKAMGLALISISEALNELQPDYIIVLGDRFETLATVICAINLNIPVIHIQGGEVTRGSSDDLARHAISKLSYLHFTATESYRQRVIQLGESPERVFNVGALNVESILAVAPLSLEECSSAVGLDLEKPTILVTLHPSTLDLPETIRMVENTLKCLSERKELQVILTRTNADQLGLEINRLKGEFQMQNSNRAVLHSSLGHKLYASALRYAVAMVGNSSSGIIETASFGLPTLNIGDREEGRLQPENVLNCSIEVNEITRSLDKLLSKKFQKISALCSNPYAKHGSASLVLETVKKYPYPNSLKKDFFDVHL